MSDMGARLRVNRVVCSGHGVCAELLPELVALDEWGYPIIADTPVPARLVRDARRAVTDCPALALRLVSEDFSVVAGARRAHSEEAQIPGRDSAGKLRT
jgi:ferredoxin